MLRESRSTERIDILATGEQAKERYHATRAPAQNAASHGPRTPSPVRVRVRVDETPTPASVPVFGEGPYNSPTSATTGRGGVARPCSPPWRRPTLYIGGMPRAAAGCSALHFASCDSERARGCQLRRAQFSQRTHPQACRRGWNCWYLARRWQYCWWRSCRGGSCAARAAARCCRALSVKAWWFRTMVRAHARSPEKTTPLLSASSVCSVSTCRVSKTGFSSGVRRQLRTTQVGLDDAILSLSPAAGGISGRRAAREMEFWWLVWSHIV